MFTSPTVIVIGAGASAEVGLPVGETLKSEIARALSFGTNGVAITSGDREIYAAIMRYCQLTSIHDINGTMRTARDLASLSLLGTSIDNVLHSHSHNPIMVAIGKIAIARMILLAEHNSKLKMAVDDGYNLNQELIKDSWYPQFWSLLSEMSLATSPADAFRNLTIISFNYDRCVELFLFSATRKFFRISDEEAARAMSGLRILHPYGSLGPLPWTGNSDALPFGGLEGVDLQKVSSRLLTFTEKNSDERAIGEIKTAYGKAEKLVFLGFGFNEMNMQILKSSKESKPATCISSTFGLSPHDISEIQNIISKSLITDRRNVGDGVGRFIAPNGSKCKELFEQCRFVLRS